MMMAKGGDNGEKWKNLRDEYRILSIRLREESRTMPRFLVWVPEWLLISLNEIENTGEKGQTWGGVKG